MKYNRIPKKEYYAIDAVKSNLIKAVKKQMEETGNPYDFENELRKVQNG